MIFKPKQIFIPIFLILVVLASFNIGVWFGQIQKTCKVCAPEELDFSLFWEALNKIQEKYVGKDSLDTQAMIYGAVAGMVESLDDPYTVFLNPEDAKVFAEDVKGSYEGVGMEIGVRKGQLQVIAPLQGTPAQKAGLKTGDKIMKIDGELTLDMTIDEAVSKIRGPKGTEVTLTIYREQQEETKEIKIVRQVIEIPSMEWELREDNIAYIKLYHFSGQASYDFSKIAIEILNSPADKIILDLRNNPGGYLGVAQDVAGWFLEKGEVVLIEDFGKDEEQKLYKAEGNARLSSYPIVILINQGSASGSEILAGALRDNRAIKLIGETSFGKGSIQELTGLQGDSSLKITTAKWLTPNGDSITDKGLEPDIEIEMTDEDYEQDKDPQLDKAIEIIKQLE